ncbi:pyridoxamine 5'-phosphate oxidase family protein [Cryobacterium fucosi]|uniref:Pyridoxamine 5'-phosphate oxidase family protein n=1 Tax=Cryobacterium fucosi TaxID=1259157 RepID=A0A4R9AXP1_9MICO|nr:pyridoxamine 5'-phosphate oxidase family protein [Cryobacterium fucosi]TFD72051.1 pyridoxamine 5'-phosphate oxidase family protein [Cryobacterium fucosi]
MLGELNDQQIDEVLHAGVVGRIGCHVDDRTYIVPITYVYSDGSVYGHSATGTKVRMMRANPAVCFEVEHVDDLADWQSVIAWGTFEELHGAEAEAGMRALATRLSPMLTSTTAQPHLGPDGTPFASPHAQDSDPAAQERPVLYRIRLTEKTGRFERR